METIVICNRKGGTGKSMVSIALADYLSLKGKRVLCVDLDSQCNMTKNYGIREHYAVDEIKSFYDIVINGVKPKDAILRVPKNYFTDEKITDVKDLDKDQKYIKEIKKMNVESRFRYGVDIIPATAAVGDKLKDELVMNRERKLINMLSELTGDYDYVVVDTAPAEDIIMFNALIAADHVFGATTLEENSVDGIESLIGIVNTLEKEFSTPKEKFSIPLRGIMITNVDLVTSKEENINQLTRLQEMCEQYNVPIMNHIVRTHPFIKKTRSGRYTPFINKVIETKMLENGKTADEMPKTIESLKGEKVKTLKNEKGITMKAKKIGYPSVIKDYIRLFDEMMECVEGDN